MKITYPIEMTLKEVQPGDYFIYDDLYIKTEEKTDRNGYLIVNCVSLTTGHPTVLEDNTLVTVQKSSVQVKVVEL